ncbi:aldose 1-epimerase [Dyadobacter psychrotolerans]|uniref:Aldose 1-epimerase n=1 Tax=Dyadobacter psychrotolerans TaxID=2541721 RepID=A0A4V2Z4H9_9BACT|nr:aldose 1-epimerase [Dyadobacter psychrotolerans]TDE16268.1 aldose 1-epimerase [Dyadobacter psychrotolerans]
MSFEIFKQQFGEVTEYIIQDSVTGNRCVILPELGGIVRQLSLRKGLTLFSVLKTPPTPQTLKDDSKSASELLFPFASRIPEGKYKFLGQEYQLAKNESGTTNAIHGLVRKQKFNLEEQLVNADHASLKLSFSLKDLEGYPFDVKFSVMYQLFADGRFVLTYEAVNNGIEPCPVMFGWHPYFYLGNEDVEAWKINIPSDQIVTFDDNMIPTGTEPFAYDQPMLLHRKELDNCFIIKSTANTAVTELISDNKHVTLKVEQEIGEGKFNYLVLYTPPARDCVAIEPLTANVNGFNNGEGLNILASANSISGTITVSLS